MSGERISLTPNKTVSKTFEDGTSVKARITNPQRLKFGRTAEHEAVHVVAARDIVSADNIPRGSALGTTRPVKLTAVAAAAPAALGHGGTGWDQFITEKYLGVNFETAKRAARSALSGKEEEIEEVATLIEERRVITQTDVNEARRNVRERRQGIFPVELKVVRPCGETYSYATRSFHSKVFIEDLSYKVSVTKSSGKALRSLKV